MKKVNKIKDKRQGAYIMQRLRKGRELEEERDIKEVQRDLSLIKSPAAGLKANREVEGENVSENEEEQMELIEDCGEVVL